MALVNRDKDQSEQREVYSLALGNLATGVTANLLIAPNPSQIVAAYETAVGISGAPVHTLFVNRFIVGTGLTTISLSATLSPVAYGTSGIQSYSTASFGVTTPAQGSTVVQTLYAGDLLFMVTSGSNTSTYSSIVELVVKNLQDVKTHFTL